MNQPETLEAYLALSLIFRLYFDVVVVLVKNGSEYEEAFITLSNVDRSVFGHWKGMMILKLNESSHSIDQSCREVFCASLPHSMPYGLSHSASDSPSILLPQESFRIL